MASATFLCRNHQQQTSSLNSSDLNLFSILTSSTLEGSDNCLNWDRRPRLDPLIVRAAALSSPSQTRNHYLHQYFPHSHHHNHQQSNRVSSVKINIKRQVRNDQSNHQPRVSNPRQSINLSASPSASVSASTSSSTSTSSFQSISILKQPSSSPNSSIYSASLQDSIDKLRTELIHLDTVTSPVRAPISDPAIVNVQCQVKTRIPSRHGNIWLHLYTNDLDDQEHLALVIDSFNKAPIIKSQSLNRTWTQSETRIDRIIRGADELSGEAQVSTPAQAELLIETEGEVPIDQLPIVRIHSECFTGEIIGSRRCDCGEQLDRSIEFIFNQSPHQGVIVYLKQEGRGIGLRNKIKAYNLQDLGFDTIEANRLLGFGDDLRDYRVASKIIEDLGLKRIRLMTNNPKKLETFRHLGLESNNDSDDTKKVEVAERISMIPYQWERGTICDHDSKDFRIGNSSGELNGSLEDMRSFDSNINKADLIENRKSEELESYLRTKVIKMS
ncbi:GTP cyclohydrolase II-domain-containing protein [Phakopsora pachyrhizi]|uniref:GTP cyclohydrolase II n=1 Tax=Phakopsora pachyrhizi TaxID=170000 RepID=A0AAV0ALE9_PHAPC|nr:GTP cyclohydrolase II-domain-containing protein [Phakopsora pachyrhizi]